MEECHGGNIYRFAESMGLREDEVIDFSASINPLGVPESARRAMVEGMESLLNYPDPDARELRVKIGARTGVNPDSLICGNGSTELIYLVVRALKPKRVLMPAPTFSEYERACSKGSCPDMAHYAMDKEHNFDVFPKDFIRSIAGDNNASSPCDMAFLCNPNNPTGRLTGKEEMLEIAEGARKAGCILVVDEAFIDFCPEASIVEEVHNNSFLVVLRSLTKFYALSGLRIGYAVLPPSLLEVVKEAKEPWTVNTLAQKAGLAALDDMAYGKRTVEAIARERERMEEGFRQLGISYVPSAANFYLLNMGKGREVTECLRKRGILVRDCSNFVGLDSTYIRVAVKSKEDNMRLLEEISLCKA